MVKNRIMCNFRDNNPEDTSQEGFSKNWLRGRYNTDLIANIQYSWPEKLDHAMLLVCFWKTFHNAVLLTSTKKSWKLLVSITSHALSCETEINYKVIVSR